MDTPPVIRRIGLPLAFLALFVVAGGHWAVLQSVAWAGMVVEYSQKAGLQEGVSQTFDGDHPCPLCLKVQTAKKEEQKAPATVVDAKKKSDPFSLGLAVVLPFHVRNTLSWPRAGDLHNAARSDRPPVPPPPSFLS
jgi:hypothetical protein